MIVSNRKLAHREKFIGKLMEDFYQKYLPKDSVYMKPSRAEVIANAYFILNHAYKKLRMKDGHNTRPEKIAALTSMVIMRAAPFAPTQPHNVKTFEEMYCNELFTIYTTSAIMYRDISKKLDRNSTFRFFRILQEFKSETIEPYIADKRLKNQTTANDYNLEMLDKDKIGSDVIITLYELL